MFYGLQSSILLRINIETNTTNYAIPTWDMTNLTSRIFDLTFVRMGKIRIMSVPFLRVSLLLHASCSNENDSTAPPGENRP